MRLESIIIKHRWKLWTSLTPSCFCYSIRSYLILEDCVPDVIRKTYFMNTQRESNHWTKQVSNQQRASHTPSDEVMKSPEDPVCSRRSNIQSSCRRPQYFPQDK
ncbi:hypothetical protein ILYODFUR_014801 [Ilyodon furcidens]|uniref:Uncharacterized protein n=1 Tax=Ilyodon furcidens TaxID=33524 RepID=A0ABV0TIQ2_9TELE